MFLTNKNSKNIKNTQTENKHFKTGCKENEFLKTRAVG